MKNLISANNLQTYILLRLQSFSVLRETKPEEHTSRFEAYCDLIDRAQCQNMRLQRGALKTSLKPGEIHVTYGDLADKWGWARPSVRRFIDDLEEAGLAVKRQFKTSYIIYLPIHVLPEHLAEQMSEDNSPDLPENGTEGNAVPEVQSKGSE